MKRKLAKISKASSSTHREGGGLSVVDETAGQSPMELKVLVEEVNPSIELAWWRELRICKLTVTK